MCAWRGLRTSSYVVFIVACLGAYYTMPRRFVAGPHQCQRREGVSGALLRVAGAATFSPGRSCLRGAWIPSLISCRGGDRCLRKSQCLADCPVTLFFALLQEDLLAPDQSSALMERLNDYIFFYLHTARISHVFLHHRKEIHFTIPHALKAHHDLSHNLRLATYHSIEQFHSIRLNFSDHHVAERAIRRRELEL